ncbi:hypothetical protein TRVA0_002S03202 [Trichomonascus vanleenenianus]|uniref:uncharacterized protein n=1 Tax=Trichomonascus vanleenenianus TaxID=2268995 RepID=UPI003EC9DE05
MITKRLARFALGPSFLDSLEEDGESGKGVFQAMRQNREKMERIMRAEEQVLGFVGLGSTSRRRGMRRSPSQGLAEDYVDMALDLDEERAGLEQYPHCPHCHQHHAVEADDYYCEHSEDEADIMDFNRAEYGAFWLTSAAHVTNFVVQWPFSIMSMRLATIKGYSTSYLDSFGRTFLHKPFSLATLFAGLPASVAYESIVFGIDAVSMAWFQAYEEKREEEARNKIEMMVHSFAETMMENGVSEFDPEELNHMMELEEQRDRGELDDIRSKLKRSDGRQFKFMLGLFNQVVLFPFTRLQYLQCLGLLPATQLLPSWRDYLGMLSIGYWKANWVIFVLVSFVRYMKASFQDIATTTLGVTISRQLPKEAAMVTSYLVEMISATRAELNLYPLMPFVYRIIAHQVSPNSPELCSYFDMTNWQGIFKSFIIETLASWSVSQVYHHAMAWYTGVR